MPRSLPGLSALHHLALRQGGVVTREQALSLGIGNSVVRRRVMSGEWTLRFGCIVVCTTARGADWRDAWAIGLRCGPGAIVTGPTAMRLGSWQIPDDLPLACGASNTHLKTPGLRVLRDTSVRQTRKGPNCLIAAPVEALIDTVLAVPYIRARALVDLALQRRWITTDTWGDAALQRVGPGRHVGPRLRNLTALVTGGNHSDAERLAGHLLHTHGLEGWVANYPFRSPDGRILAELDFALPELKICIEIDGRAFHSDAHAFERDRARQNMLVAEGWLVLRFTWQQLTEQPEWVVATIRRAIALRRAAV